MDSRLVFLRPLGLRLQVRNELVAEQITTSKDASIPGVLVNSADTAAAQEKAITTHTLGKWGPYSKLAQTDPNRATYLDGVTLRSALNLAVMGFKVSDLVIGIGAFIIVMGATNLLLLAPVVYLVGATQKEGSRAAKFMLGRQHPAASGS